MKPKYIILLFVVLVITLYIYQNKTLKNKLIGKVHKVVPELNNSTLYKWKNGDGEWQVTDKPPAKGIPYTSVSSQDQMNIMPSTLKKKQ